MTSREQPRRSFKLSQSRHELLTTLLQQQGGPGAAETRIARRHGDEPLPLSFGQQRLWFIAQLAAESPAYNQAALFLLEGPLDASALAAAFGEILRRHEVLRSTLVAVSGQPRQVVAPPPATPPPLSLVDLGGLAGATGEREALCLAAAEHRLPFDLERGPLLRLRLLRRASGSHALLVTMHHVISDGWSVGLLLREVAVLYEAFAARRPSPLPALAVQYGDYAFWQRQPEQQALLAAELAWWRERLSGAPALLDLPTDHPRPAVWNDRCAGLSSNLPPALAAALAGLCREEGVTLFMLLAAAFAALLGRYAGSEDLVLGSPVAGRERAELAELIGFFVNTVVLRLDLSGEPSARQLLRRSREVVLGALSHSFTPFDLLVQELAPERQSGRSPIVQVLFALQNAPRPPLTLPGLALTALPQPAAAAQFELELAMAEVAEGDGGGALACQWTYARELFETTTIERWSTHWAVLLEGMTRDADRPVAELPLFSAAERHQVVVEWNATDAPGRRSAREACLHELFAAQAERTPESVALSSGDRQLTYRELDRRAGRLAETLLRLGLHPEVPVGVAAERSPELLVALLAVLKAGGAYLPLDPSYPQARLALMLEEVQVPLVLVEERLRDRLPEGPARVVSLGSAELASGPAALPVVVPGNLAYVVFTSGSTGRPKGVMVPHGAIANRLLWMQGRFPLAAGDRVLQKTPYGFDASIWELFVPLFAGAQVVLAEPGGHRDNGYLLDAVARHAITVLQLVPSQLAAFLDQEGVEEKCRSLRRMFCGGEALPGAVAEGLLTRTSAELCNLYGPTEAAIDASFHACPRGQALPGILPIGRPLDNDQVYLVDSSLRPVARPRAGEIVIGGLGLARGYRGRPELTAERFVPDSLGPPGGRLYRTGDLGRFTPDGVIEILGRIDHQLKLRGVRIEPGEIEARLREHPAVQDAVVLVRADVPGDSHLVAYVVRGVVRSAAPGEDLRDLRAFLSARLPEAMVPASIVEVGELPRLPNGKIDRKALSALAPARPARLTPTLEPSRTPVEELLAEIWAGILGQDRVGGRVSAHDNFFELGGHSLLATRLLSRVRAAFQVDVSLRRFFGDATIAGLAACIEEEQQAARLAAPPILPVPRDGSGEFPLSFAQQRLWFIDQLQPGNVNYNLALPLRINGRLDLAPLARALSEVVRRHEVLRTRLPTVEGRGVQVIEAPQPVRLPLVDLASLPAPAIDAEAFRLAEVEANHPFDLARGGLLRIAVVRKNAAATDHLLLLTLHHVVSDGWSNEVLAREVMTLYEAFAAGQPSPLAELPIQFVDYAVWQREWLQGEELAAQLAFWTDQLAGAPQVLDLPLDRRRPAVQAGRSASRWISLPLALSQEVRALCRREGATSFMVLLAAWATLLGRQAGQEDVLLGTPIAGRHRQEIEDLIGLFVNTLVIRTRISGSPGFAELLGRVRRVALDAYAHPDLPFERLVEELVAERNLAHAPLYQVLFGLQNASELRVAIPGLSLAPLELPDRSVKVDLVLALRERDDGTTGLLEYDTALFDGSTIERLAGNFTRLLEAAMAEPSRPLPELPLLSPGERHQLLAEWNDTSAPFPETTLLHQFFEAAVERAPGAVAAVCGGRQLTYAELEAQSNRLAHLLQGRGDGGWRRGAAVGVWVERSLDMLVAVLGVLKAGGHYVALDDAWPAERVESILAATGASGLVAGASLLGAVEEMRWRLPALSDAVCLGIAEPEPPVEAFDAGRVRELWDLVAERAVDRVTAGGFVSALTGEPMSEAEVDEYRDRVLALAAPWLHGEARVLEIGSGAGLLFWQMASRVAHATGVDPSPLTQERQRERAGREGAANVRLLTGFAHELEDLIGADERFDLILLASTVQFFPGPRYLERVLSWARGQLAPGGALIVADVIDARRRGELRRAIAEHRGEAGGAAAAHRQELAVDEGFFHGLGATVHRRTAGFANELRFRYDVVLRDAGRDEPAARRKPLKYLWTGWHVDRSPADRLPPLAAPDDVAYVIHTSGSTGEPKGIVVQHRPAANLVAWINRAFEVGPRDRGLFVASLCFDLSVYDIFGLLAAGGTVHVATREELADPDHLVSLLRSGRITLWDSAPAALMQLAPLFPAVPIPSSRLRRVLLSGDWIPVTLPDRIRRTFPKARVMALGGATEATVWSNWFPVGRVDSGWPSIPYGRPIANARYHVLDPELAPCPIGVAGDLYIGGDCLCAGYTRADLTAQAFLPDPFSGAPGGRLYRTGDRARHYADGNLEFLGRGDQQVKVRGFRIELGEIEVVLGSHPAVRDAVVLAREDMPGDRRLVAYVVARQSSAGDQPPRAEELRNHLQARLPEYMLPGAFVFLDALPLTPNGKLDRQALPAPERTETYAAPADPVEEIVAGIWTEVLGKERISIHDNFFDLGGHSLLVTQVASWMRSVFRVELPLRQLFETPTIAGLARVVRARDLAGAAPSPPPIAPLPRELVGWELPLSFAQQRLWFLDRLEPGGTVYNIPAAVRLRGAVAVPELEWIFAMVVRRHEVLRTTFATRGGGAVQIIAPGFVPALPVVDLSGLAQARRETRRARALALEVARRPFDLERGPLLRLCLVRLGESDHLLLMALHHIVADGWSLGVLLREIATLHEGLAARAAGRSAAALPALPVQYADFAHWQREWLSGEVLESQLAYWRRQLAGAPRMLELPLDRPRPARQTFRGSTRSLKLPPSLGAAMRELCRREGATPFMVLMAAWGLLLGRHAGQRDLLVGTPIAGRNRREVEHLIGCFVNTLVLRIDLRQSPTFVELLGRVRAAALDGYTHQDVPFERLVDDLAEERGLAVSPLFQAVFTLQNPAEPGGQEDQLSVPGLSLTPQPVDLGQAKFDLTLLLAERADQSLVGLLEYNPDLFDGPTVDRLAGHFALLLTRAVADPQAEVWGIPLLADAERRELQAWSGAGEAQPLSGSLPARFATRAAARPDAVAAVCAGACLTYGELDRRADRLAHRLLAAGVAPGSRVCLAAARGLGLPAGILGILKAGCAYVPLDPSYPEERLEWVLKDAGAAALVSDAETPERLRAWPGRVLPLGEAAGETAIPRLAIPPISPELPAYVIYTSGSTGRPKGVVVSHGNVLQLMAASEKRFGFGEGDVWTLFHSSAFDFSVWELWGALLYGGRLVVVPYLTSRSPQAMLELVEQEEVTVLNQTPSAFQPFQHAEAQREEAGGRSLRWVIFGGEALEPRSLAGWWRRRKGLQLTGPALVNMYGITETTVHVTWRLLGAAEILGDRGSVIGAPLRHLRVHVLDPWGEPVPAGVAGELCVGGVGVSQGYLGRPELTAERFVPDGFGTEPGSRLYRSGDLGRWRRGGDLEHLGRIDRQVKVRGFRIEPGEIEAVLRQQPGVETTVVLAREDRPGDRRLVAYLVGKVPGGEELRRRLGESLPEHMVPSAFVFLPALPLTANGKVDRQALPAPAGAARLDPGAEHVAPRTFVEEVLAAIWEQVLELDRVSVHANFFTLGGDSILSLRVVALARERGLAVELADLFERQTIADLAAAVRFGGAEEAVSEPLSLISSEDRQKLPADIEDAYPLTLLQAGMMFHMDLAPEDPPYHNVDSWHLRARFAQPLFEQALARVIARHPVLRTSFDLTGYGEPLQLVHRRARLPVPVVDLIGLDAARHEGVLAEFIAGEKRRLLDRSRPPQIRFHVHLRAAGSFQLTLTENHAIFDGWSLHSTLSEIFSGYFALLAGEELPKAPPPAATYRDFVRLERLALQSAEHDRFWDEWLRDFPATSLPPLEGPVPAGPRSRVIDLPIPEAVADGLKRLAAAAMVPLKSVLLAAHVKVMALVSGQREVVTGLTSHGRQDTAGGEDVRGLFLNVLPFRVALGAGSWEDLVRETFRAELRLFPFRRYPLAALQTRRGGPVFTTAFNYIHFHVVEELLRSGDVEVLDFKRLEGTNFALQATFTRSPLTGELGLSLEHDRSRLTDNRARGWLAGLYQRVLTAMAAVAEGGHEAASLLAASERHQLVREWNDARPATVPRGGVLPAMFAAQMARTPDAVAVAGGPEEGEARLTYAELDRRASRLARRLRVLGVGPEVLVGLCAERTVGMVVGILGILKAGGAYLPLDPAYPEERLRFLLADAEAPVAVAQVAVLDRLPAGSHRVVVLEEATAAVPAAAGGDDSWPAVLPDNPAYVIYTSGSTGRPKGVVVSHHNVSRLFAATEPQLSFGPWDVWTLFHSFAFDVSVWELWGALLHGGRLVVVPYWVSRSPQSFRELLAREGVTRLSQTPSAFRQLLQVPGDGRGELAVETVIFAGEALEPRSVLPWFEREGERARLVNMYGITETTVHVTYLELGAAEIAGLPGGIIGRPMADLEMYVLDSRGELAPLGVAGEMFVGGPGLARGYLGRPELTASRFVPHPFAAAPGARLYRSGDLGRTLPSGELEYLGRIDAQVKIRGYRIELGEVEAVLAAHPDVAEAAAVVREDRPGDHRLVAYVVPRAEAWDAALLRRYLQERLPEPMVPGAFVRLAALPLTRNGKVDRRALQALAPETERAAVQLVVPRTPTEELLAGIWAHVLQLARVGVEERFWDLGGHSLLAVQVMSRVKDVFGVKLPLRALFDTPTVAGLSARIEALRSAGTAPERPPLGPAGGKPLPLSLAQSASRRRDGSSPPPMSFGQEGFWRRRQREARSVPATIPLLFALEGRADLACLCQAVQEVVNRHEVLRTTLREDSAGPVQVVHAALQVRFPMVDLQRIAPAGQQLEIQRWSIHDGRSPFDFERGPLFRITFFRCSERVIAVLFTLHHVVFDGWSGTVLMDELSALYQAFRAGRPSPLPPPAVQYQDFARWQRETFAGEALADQVTFWREHLRGAVPVDLAADRPRPSQMTFAAASESFVVPPAIERRLEAFAAEHGATLFMTLLAAFKALLRHETGQDDIVVTCLSANRNQTELESLIGYFATGLPLRTAGGLTFRDLLEQVRAVALLGHEHPYILYEPVLDGASFLAPGDSGGLTSFRVMFQLAKLPPPAGQASSDLRVTRLPVDTGRIGQDLSLFFSQSDRLSGQWRYNLDVLDPERIVRMRDRYLQILAAAVADPDCPLAELLPETAKLQAVGGSHMAAASPVPVSPEAGR